MANPGCHVCFTRAGVHPHDIEHLETVGDFTRTWNERVFFCSRCEVDSRATAAYDRMGILE